MNQQILSQDEVDALLQGITGESQKLEQEDIPQGGIRDYDLASQERIVRSVAHSRGRHQRNGKAGSKAAGREVTRHQRSEP